MRGRAGRCMSVRGIGWILMTRIVRCATKFSPLARMLSAPRELQPMYGGIARPCAGAAAWLSKRLVRRTVNAQTMDGDSASWPAVGGCPLILNSPRSRKRSRSGWTRSMSEGGKARARRMPTRILALVAAVCARSPAGFQPSARSESESHELPTVRATCDRAPHVAPSPARFPTMLACVHQCPPPSVTCPSMTTAAAGERCRTGVNETETETGGQAARCGAARLRSDAP
jgi:hypothetical protein